MGQSSSTDKIHIGGFCDELFEPVQEHLLEMLTKGKEENVQLCVYVDGKCVVDLYGTAVGDKEYNQEKLQNIFSSGKSFEDIAMAVLYDKGLFKYEDKIAKHWPEFSQNGKENVKICDVLRHEAGLAYFQKDCPSLDDLKTDNIKLNKVSDIIEKEELHFPEYESSDSKREYHSFTRGFILNEIVRRIDPHGRTLGQIFKDEIKVEGVSLGLCDTELSKCVPISSLTLGFLFQQMLTPTWAGRKISKGPMGLLEMMMLVYKMSRNSGSRKHCKDTDSIKNMGDFEALASSSPWRQAELSSVNFQANARGCAKLASMMALKGDTLISQATWEEMHSQPTFSQITKMPGDGCRCSFTKGGVCYHFIPKDPFGYELDWLKNREGYYGWIGYGGSVVQWHPELKIGFAFIPTFMNSTELVNERGGVLQQIVKDCLVKDKDDDK